MEVLSADDRAGEVEAKVRMYLQFGTRMIILIDPEQRTAAVHTPANGIRLDDTLDGGDVVPGWSLPLRELFA